MDKIEREEEEMLTTTNALVGCCHGLHESTTYLQGRLVHVHVAFVTPCGALLLGRNKKTKELFLPYEKFTVGHLLLGSPERVALKSFGLDPSELLVKRTVSRTRVLGMQNEGNGDCDILLRSQVLKVPYLKELYVENLDQLAEKVKAVTASVYVAATAIGWEQATAERLAA